MIIFLQGSLKLAEIDFRDLQPEYASFRQEAGYVLTLGLCMVNSL